MDKFVIIEKKNKNQKKISLNLNNEEKKIGINKIKFIFDNIDNILNNQHKKGRV